MAPREETWPSLGKRPRRGLAQPPPSRTDRAVSASRCVREFYELGV